MLKAGVGPEPIMSVAELKPLLHLARRQAVNCAIAMGKDKQGIILLHRRTKPRKLLAELRRQAKAAGTELDPTSIRFGRASVDGASDSAMVTFTVNKPAPGPMRRALLEQVRPAGFQRCEIVVDEKLESETDTEADEADDMAHGGPRPTDGSGAPAPGAGVPSPGAAPSVAPGGAMAPRERSAGASTDPAAPGRAGAPGPMTALLELAKRIPPAIAADPARKPSLLKLVADAQGRIRTGDTQGATAGLEALRRALAPMDALEGGTTGAGQGGPSPNATHDSLLTLAGFPSPEPDAPPAAPDATGPNDLATPSPGPGGAAAQPGSSDPLARRQGEGTQDWEARLGIESNALTRRQEEDPEGANAARLRMNGAIAADPEFQENYYAGQQGLSVEGFHNVSQYEQPVAGFPLNPNEAIEQRLLTFIHSNANPYARMGADGRVYTFRDASPEAFQTESGLAALFNHNEEAANNLAQQVHRDGLRSLPPSVWAMAAIGSIGGSGVTRGPKLRSPAPVRGPDVSKVNGRWPINSALAGQVYPLERLPPELRAKYPNSVRFTSEGFPDFEPYAVLKVKAPGLTGEYEADARLSNDVAGIRRTPDGYVWHHVHDGANMFLIPQDLHQAVRHTGSSAKISGGGAAP
jgi:hypothetical protein